MFASSLIKRVIPSLLLGPQGALLGGVLGSLSQRGGQFGLFLAAFKGPLNALLGGRSFASPFPQTPVPFQRPQLDIFQILRQLLGGMTPAFSGAGSGSAPSSGVGTPAGASGAGEGASTAASSGIGSSMSTGLGRSIGSIGSKIDSMFAQAEKLASSGKQSDMLKAQQMMQKATQMFQLISNLMKVMHEAAMTAIRNMGQVFKG